MYWIVPNVYPQCLVGALLLRHGQDVRVAKVDQRLDEQFPSYVLKSAVVPGGFWSPLFDRERSIADGDWFQEGHLFYASKTSKWLKEESFLSFVVRRLHNRRIVVKKDSLFSFLERCFAVDLDRDTACILAEMHKRVTEFHIPDHIVLHDARFYGLSLSRPCSLDALESCFGLIETKHCYLASCIGFPVVFAQRVDDFADELLRFVVSTMTRRKYPDALFVTQTIAGEKKENVRITVSGNKAKSFMSKLQDNMLEMNFNLFFYGTNEMAWAVVPVEMQLYVSH